MATTNYIAKNDTQILKGVSILLMLFYHLFFMEEYVSLCTSLFVIDGFPLVYYLSRGANPVSFFLILGGYGMYIVTETGDKHRYSRILKLLIHYWVITLCFLSLGCILQPDLYPGSLRSILENFSTYRTTYNVAIWFLLPYILISLMAKWIFGLTKKYSAIMILGIFFLINILMSFLSKRYETLLLQDPFYCLIIPIRTLRLMFAFVLGGMAAREGYFKQLRFFSRPWKAWICIILLFSTRCLLTTSMFNDFYAFAIIYLFLQTKRYSIVDQFLAFMGKHSMNIWMIHNWIFISFFTSFIYGFKFPIACYIALIATSLLCSIIVDKVCSFIHRTL